MIDGEIPCGSARPRWSLLTLAASARAGRGRGLGAALVASQAAIAPSMTAVGAGRGGRRPPAMSASNATRRVTMACSQRSRVAAQAARACPSVSRLRSRPVRCAWRAASTGLGVLGTPGRAPGSGAQLEAPRRSNRCRTSCRELVRSVGRRRGGRTRPFRAAAAGRFGSATTGGPGYLGPPRALPHRIVADTIIPLQQLAAERGLACRCAGPEREDLTPRKVGLLITLQAKRRRGTS